MNNKIRVLIVDDSGFVVATLTRKLSVDAEIEVVGSARNGIEAIEKVKSLRPDVVTMDVIMPEMNGLEALIHIMAEQPTPVIMLSALTGEGAETTIKALEIGAVDFFLKPSSISPSGTSDTTETLIAKIKHAARASISGSPIPVYNRVAPGSKINTAARSLSEDNFKIVVIGCSTGGPRALMQLIPQIPADIQAAFLIVQHMPPVFTKSLAERLDKVSQIAVKEAAAGDVLGIGQALLAPGGYHMTVSKGRIVRLNQDPPVWGVRPSVDITMKSASDSFKSRVIGVILTGMGYDGTAGAAQIKQQGGKIFAEDESTCAVFGMPQSAARAGCVDLLLPLPKIASRIVEACTSVEAGLV